MDKENAAKILKALIDACILKGGIFANTESVGQCMEALQTLQQPDKKD